VRPLQQRTLDAVVAKAHGRFVGCLRGHAADLPASEGQIVLEVTVTSRGAVSAARLVSPAIQSTKVAACLIAQAKGMRFPRNSDADVAFRFPLVYRRRE
jgi:hypothetical protein